MTRAAQALLIVALINSGEFKPVFRFAAKLCFLRRDRAKRRNHWSEYNFWEEMGILMEQNSEMYERCVESRDIRKRRS